MNISIREIDGLSAIQVVISEPEFFPNVCEFVVIGELDEGQPYKRPTVQDPFGQQEYPPSFTVHDAWIEMTPEYHQMITVSDVEDHLQEAGFYTDIIEILREELG